MLQRLVLTAQALAGWVPVLQRLVLVLVLAKQISLQTSWRVLEPMKRERREPLPEHQRQRRTTRGTVVAADSGCHFQPEV